MLHSLCGIHGALLACAIRTCTCVVFSVDQHVGIVAFLQLICVVMHIFVLPRSRQWRSCLQSESGFAALVWCLPGQLHCSSVASWLHQHCSPAARRLLSASSGQYAAPIEGAFIGGFDAVCLSGWFPALLPLLR
jgi:hypothetical protein